MIPLGMHHTVVVGFFFMLREIELSLMLYNSVDLDLINLVVRTLLPASKTDPQALSRSRFWGCVCDEGVVVATECPFHDALAQKTMLKERFGAHSSNPILPAA